MARRRAHQDPSAARIGRWRGCGARAPPGPSEKAATASRKLGEAAEALASEASSVAPARTTATRKGDQPASRIPAVLWQDPDVRWLTGYNEPELHAYVNRELYAELLWSLSL